MLESPAGARVLVEAATRFDGANGQVTHAPLVLVLTAIAVLVLGACGSIPGPTPAPASELAGREFSSTAVVGHDLVPDTSVSIRFSEDGSVSIRAGCNSMGGIWAMAGDILRLDIGSMTDMGCPQDRMAQDGWVSEFVGSRPTAIVEGNELVLTSGGVTMTLLDR